MVWTEKGLPFLMKMKSEPRSCVKVEVAVLGFPSLIVLMVSVGVKATLNSNTQQVSELRSCVKVEVAVLGSRP